MTIFSVGGAIVVGSVVGAGASIYAGKKSAGAIKSGADAAAQATIQSTQLQIDEIRRQFDYQAEVLYPRLKQQYAAAGAFGDLLGIGNNNQPGSSDYDPGASNPIYNSSGQQVGGSGSYAPTATSGQRGGAVQPQVQGGPMVPAPNRAQGGGRYQRQGGGRLFDNEGREIDQNQSGLVPPAMQAQFEASGMSPFDFAASKGLIPNDYRGGASTGQYEVEGGGGPPIPQFPASGSTQFERGGRGQFIDPNVDPLALSDAEQLTAQVGSTLLAPTAFDQDVYGNYVTDNQYAAGSPEESNMFRRSQDVTAADAFGGRSMVAPGGGPSDRMAFAEGNQIFGQTFEEGPGYNFMVEEMNRELDRKNSAGGNYGGRALMEAERRSKGLAAGEFYNWAAGRDRDLSRTERAFDEDYQRQLTDIGRFDQADLIDIGRGDEAFSEFERQRGVDVGRGDRSIENYLGRRQGDVTRMDRAVGERDRLRGVDLAREDTAYQNYLANLRAMAGFGDVAGQVVNASQGASAGIANAYGSEGSQLAATYGAEGTNLASNYGNTITNVNNAITSGIQGYSTYNYLQKNPGTAVTLPGGP